MLENILGNFFQLSPLPANQLFGWYDIRLVILSYLVATFASYIALDFTGRLRDFRTNEFSQNLWLVGGALAMGSGIWSMHFIGMLAFKMDMTMVYDPTLTLLSLFVAIAASAFALSVLKVRVIHRRNLIFGGIILGLAIAAMHYTGMAAMEINMRIHYIPSLFFLSIVIAILASEAALWLALKGTQVVYKMQFKLKFISAFVMGAAICGMHYVGMWAAVFTPISHTMSASGNALNPELMSVSIAAVTFVILGIAVIASTYKESVNQQLLLTARQAGMSEVASSVLHNVGNVLNSVNVSSNIIGEKITHSKLSNLVELNKLLKDKNSELSLFLKKDARAEELPNFINMLTNYWLTEQKALLDEVQTLQKEVGHIKSIVATQQDLSRMTEFEQRVDLSEMIDESILITGLDNADLNVQIKKEYDEPKMVLIDKVKLLQILVNVFKNAKEALLESKKQNKNITIQIKFEQDPAFFSIHVLDNGVGIDKDKIVKIFFYGFTTKKSGHGFGLHTCAILAKEMGGNLKAVSEGKGKGAEFILTLPYQMT